MSDTLDKQKVVIHTDGACKDNPGPGGWAFVMVQDDIRTERAGVNPSTTNNRMELQAAVEALEALPEPSEVELVSDSAYVVDGMTSWIHRWKAAGWVTSRHKPVANRDQWERLDRLSQLHRVEWRWVRGHSGDPENERCDQLANEQAGIRPGEQQWWLGRRPKRTGAEKRSRNLQPVSSSSNTRQQSEASWTHTYLIDELFAEDDTSRAAASHAAA